MDFDYPNFAAGVIGIIRSLLSVYMWVVIIRVLISWISPDPYNPIVQILRGVTDPPLNALRRLLPSAMWQTGLDFSPLILIVLLQVIMLLLDNIRF
jgi:YggT family protein